ncbi:MAG: hypothetical protein AAF577_08550 [Pseudomonadota bacterium]
MRKDDDAMALIPTTYEEWEHCITVSCGIPLTADFVATRIAALENENDYHTKRFVEVWGDGHRAQTLQWFREAATRLGD